MIMSIILTSSNFIFPLITFTYVARILQPEGTGKVAFVQSAITYFTYIAMLGVAGYGRRECAKVRDDPAKLSGLVKELLCINLVSTVVAYILLFLSLFIIPKFSDNKTLFITMSATILLQTIGIEWLYQALEKYSYITVRSLIFKIISIILILIFVRQPSDYILYGGILTFSLSASFLMNFINARRYVSIRDAQIHDLKRHLSPIMVFFFSSIIITVYGQLDALMIGFMKGDYEVGIYNAALRIKSVVVSVSTAITGVLIPRMTAYYNKGSQKEFYELLTKSFRVTLSLMFPMTIFIMLNPKDVLMVLGGEKYLSADSALLVLMACSIVLSLTNFFGNQILIPKGMEKRYSFSVFVGLLIDIVLNILLIPGLGAVGAAIATLVTETWNMVWMGLGCKTEIRESLFKINYIKYLLPLCIASAIIFALGYLTAELHFLIRLIINALLFFGIYYSLLTVQKDPIILEGIAYVKRILKWKKS